METRTNDSSQITHISDTALWVSVYRAMETKRKDALFRDPYAEILAGERGRQIAENMSDRKSGAWPMIVRTAVIDEFVTRALTQDAVDTVINLAAGLDTRPYRLDLPESLRWIEVDLPEILSYKEEKLANATPRCTLERVRLDLTNIEARKNLFVKINRDAKRALVITEGLLIYLSSEDVASLARDLHAQQNFRRWVIDIATPTLLLWLLKRRFRSFAEGTVQMRFAPEEGPGFFKAFGWNEAEVRAVSKEARRLKREMPGAWLYRLLSPFASKKMREFYSRMDSYFVLLERT
ncbi:MAG: class I SAM-dependent methyltransferase [Bacteroidota bacterium]|nr:class I SAM-dependent methyltransferase [Bacteroidota bacterium]